MRLQARRSQRFRGVNTAGKFESDGNTILQVPTFFRFGTFSKQSHFTIGFYDLAGQPGV
jgi:hypothetical protein